MAKPLRSLPLQVGLVALLFYCVTLSHGVTFESLPLTAKIAGWDWLPMTRQPLLWLLTLPLRLLPGAWLPAGLNFFSAVCAAAVLGILARTLELLPWFRQIEMLKGWQFRLPMLLAVVVCGMEFNFWQDATAITGEMLDLLLMVSAVWCLLEYRADKSNHWLSAAAIVWGAGMTENWVMQILLPLFIAALVWQRGLNFFQRRFILKMAALGLAGFSIYALLPTINGLLPGSPWSFSKTWIVSLKESKTTLAVLHGEFWVIHRLVTVAVLFFFLLPALAFLMRFGDDDTRNKSPLDQVLIWIFRGLRVALLLFCVWLVFDPVLGPRKLLARQMNVALPLLTFDYLNALCIGFLAGNILLAPSDDESRRRSTFGRQLAKWLERATVPGLTVFLTLILMGLIARNLPAIAIANRQPLTQFGELALHSLPPGGGIVVSDFQENLEVFQAAQIQDKDKQGWLPVDLQSLPAQEYQSRLSRSHFGDWQISTNANEPASEKVLRLMSRLAQTNRIFYLHPSADDMFEIFRPQPTGSVVELKQYPTNMINPPRLSAESIKANENFWDDCSPQIESLLQVGTPSKSLLANFAEKQLYIEAVVPAQIGLLKTWYSTALNAWGVELQRNGLLLPAQRRFNQALDLNSNNWVARVNLYCNTNLQNGTAMSLEDTSTLSDQIGSPEKLAQALNHLGPVDEPDYCFILGKAYQKAGFLRLAMQQLDRAHTLSPGVLAPEFSLAELYISCRLNDQATTTINQLESVVQRLPANAELDLSLAMLETDAWLSKTNLARAEKTLRNAVEKHPDDEQTLNSVSEAYFSVGDYTNADLLAGHLLEREPDYVPALLVRSGILIKTRQADMAIPVLNHVLSLTNSLQAKLNRAIAYAQTRNFSAAKLDYLELEISMPDNFLAEYGLAQMAEMQHDTNQAIHYLNICLSKVPPGSAQWSTIQTVLESLHPSISKN